MKMKYGKICQLYSNMLGFITIFVVPIFPSCIFLIADHTLSTKQNDMHGSLMVQ